MTRMSKKILFIGSLNKEEIVAGDTVKNSILVDSLKKYNANIH